MIVCSMEVHTVSDKGILVVCAADFSNLFMGHSTWDSWSQITKIFKHYDFSLSLPGLASQRMSFSSYPGELFSDDDL